MGRLEINALSDWPGRAARFLPVAATLALATLAFGAERAPAQGGGFTGCTQSQPCIMMVQIDGLEAADVTPATTPFLYGLAHPDGDSNDDGTLEVPGTASLGAGRNGWTWQAPRASMTAGLASNFASLMTGGYAEQTGIPGDDLVRELERIRLGGSDELLGPGQPVTPVIAPGDVEAETLFQLIADQVDGAQTAAFVGDPNLGQMVVGPVDNGDFPTEPVTIGWYPTPDSPDQDPALCDLPRAPVPPPGPPTRACAASDAQTLAQALNQTQNAANVLLTYVELAELGHLKRQSAQVDQPNGMNAALQQVDTALNTFLTAYANNAATQARWANTILMVTGTNGYEVTDPTKRVPDPDTPDEDLENHVSDFVAGGGTFNLVPQGTVATVYSTGFNDTAGQPSAAHRTALANLKAHIENVTTASSACQTDGGCIEEVLYARPELTPTGTAAGTVGDAHPSWRLDHENIEFDPLSGDTTRTPSGRGGELVVVMKPGWASGKAIPSADEISTQSMEDVITNPYQASTGGPRNRAVAAIVNGFGGAQGVRALDAHLLNAGDGDRYPVTSAPQGTQDEPDCGPDPDTVTADVVAANADPGDDSLADGHECQAETLDFGPTVAALLQVAMPPDQICGRLLTEAFSPERGLKLPTDDASIPDAFFTQGPVTPPEGQQYPQSDKDVTFEFDTTVRNRVLLECGDETVVATTFECKLDTGDYEACTSPVTLNGLSIGIHEYCVRAVSDELRSEPECAKFEVIDRFDFDGLIRDLRAGVTDYDGNGFAKAPNGRRMNRIQISGDFGKEFTAVTLTLYKQTSGKRLCGNAVFRPKLASARASATCPLTGVARFKPFKLDRGHVDMRLKIPSAYKPTHVGLSVQEISAKTLDPAQQAACAKTQSLFCLWDPVNAADGGIVKVVGARKLHALKGQKKKKRKAKKGGRR